MTTRAYYRISTDQQDGDNQASGVMQYAEARGLLIDEEYRDTASGNMPWQKRDLARLIALSQPGDILLTPEFSRLARSTLQTLEILKACAEREIVVHVTKLNFVLDSSISSKMMVFCFSMSAEVELYFIQQRTAEALRKRKASGLPMGRPAEPAKNLRLDKQATKLDGWKAQGLPMASIAKLAGCARSTLYAWAARRRPDWVLD